MSSHSNNNNNENGEAILPDSAAEFKTHDGLFEYVQADPNRPDPSGRVFNYAMLGATRVVYASIARLAVIKVIHSLSASADVLALSKVEVDISKIEVGRSITVKWRGKPVFIRRRTQEEIAAAVADDKADLRDKQTDASRVKNPEWLVVIGICTHLGCVPINGEGLFKGWFCPCHGSHYDTSGRIRVGPAPLNLEVPEYQFPDSNHLILG